MAGARGEADPVSGASMRENERMAGRDSRRLTARNVEARTAAIRRRDARVSRTSTICANTRGAAVGSEKPEIAPKAIARKT